MCLFNVSTTCWHRIWFLLYLHLPVLVYFIATVPFMKHHCVASYLSRWPHNLHFLQLNPAGDSRWVSITGILRPVKACTDSSATAFTNSVTESPDTKVVVFSTPAPVGVRESIYLKKLCFGHRCHSSEVAFVTQPERGRCLEITSVMCDSPLRTLGMHDDLLYRTLVRFIYAVIYLLVTCGIPANHQVLGLLVTDVYIVIIFRN